MGIMMVTSLNSLAKTMEMRMKWQKRQEEGDYAPDNNAPVDNTFQKQVDEMRYPEQDRSSRMEADIDIKLSAGKELSSEEMQYLKKNNPGTYQKAKIIERERKAYEKSLDSCTTKEEVEQLEASRAEAAVNRVRSILKNTFLSREQKQDLLKMEHYKAASLDDATREFMDTTEYKTLPDGILPKKNAKDEEDSTSPLSGLQAQARDKQSQQAENAEQAAEYEVPKEASDKKTASPAQEEPSTDDADEGSILKAVMDEELRWAKEEEENAADPENLSPAQAGEAVPFSQASRSKAQAAYFAAQTYLDYTETPAVDVKP